MKKMSLRGCAKIGQRKERTIYWMIIQDGQSNQLI